MTTLFGCKTEPKYPTRGDFRFPVLNNVDIVEVKGKYLCRKWVSLEKTLCQEWNHLFALCELEPRKDAAERLGRALQVNFEWRARISFLLRCSALQAGAYYPAPTAMNNILNCKCQLKNPSVLDTLHPVQIRDEVWLHFASVFPLSSFGTCAFLKNWVKSWDNNILLPLLSLVGIPTALNTVNSDPTEGNSTLALDNL